MNTLRLLVIFLIGCASARQPVAAEKAAATYISAVRSDRFPDDYLSTIRLMVRCIEGTSVGTGFAIDSTHLLTAKHVAVCEDDKVPIMIVGISVRGKSFVLKQDKLSEDHDLARLVLDRGVNPPGTSFERFVTISYIDHEVGDIVCDVTGDDKIFMTRRCGEIIPSSDTYSIWISQRVVPGNSGSALHDSHGDVIGVITRGIWGGNNENAGYVIPIKYAKDLL